ncbi:hypothetical protein TorRG33x02_234540 [Trema orientale]|uniref:Uncharacterized protein n=1 Tax=Trema orientale TaxID=63057 RepID=A0A2P5E2Z6_TREOI|nr:hypothetical protein TorRG33x02_234540 [Trema orientale]
MAALNVAFVITSSAQLCLTPFQSLPILINSNRTSNSLDGQHRITPLPNSLNRHISTNSSSIDNNNEVEEVLQLVAQILLFVKNVVSSWDFRLNSPRDIPNITRTQVVTGAFNQTNSKLGINSPIPGI